MSLDTNLNKCRGKVQALLKDEMKGYLKLMGAWFRGKLSKEEFDCQARNMFTDDTVRAHNEFLLAMLNRCQSAAVTLGARDMNRVPSTTSMLSPPLPQPRQKPLGVKKKPFVKANFTQRFQPANQLRQVRALVSPPSASSKTTFACSSHGLLPDAAMVEGRLYVAAWEIGLDNVEKDVYRLISLAVENLMKDLVSHVVSSRRGYRVSNSLKIKQYVGLDVPAVYLSSVYVDNQPVGRNDFINRAEREEADTVQSLARTGHMAQPSGPITALDMFRALQSNPDVIGSFTAYTLAMERLSTRLYHAEGPVTTDQSAAEDTRPSLFSLRSTATGCS